MRLKLFPGACVLANDRSQRGATSLGKLDDSQHRWCSPRQGSQPSTPAGCSDSACHILGLVVGLPGTQQLRLFVLVLHPE